jgi:hypothetical protein
MDAFFVAIQQAPVSIWMREDPYAYFVALAFHAIGMALLVGGGIAFCLRALGIGGEAVLHRFRGFFPVMWLGAGLAVASGILLLCAYPAKALTNPVFAVKIACLAGAAWLVGVLARRPSANRAIAAVALSLWLAGVAAGKLLLHTYEVLLVGR